jgi:hypothetical protein
MFRIERLDPATGLWAALPCESAQLALRSLAEDTLALGGMDWGALSVRQGVRVTRAAPDGGAQTLFEGRVSRAGLGTAAGSLRRLSATVSGPWRDMERTAYTQPWPMWVVDGDHPGGRWQPRATGRVLLNQNASGAPVTVRDQIADILYCCAATRPSVADPEAAAQAVGSIPPGITIPFDECRDLSCAQAAKKELRFLPRAASRFDYAETGAALIRIRVPAAQEPDAPWLAGYAADGLLLGITDEVTDEPPLGVQLEVETGGSKRAIWMQEAGDVSDPAAVVRGCLSLAGSGSDIQYSFMEVLTEDAPETSPEPGINDITVYGEVSEWLRAHARSLWGKRISKLQSGPLHRDGEADKADYPRITDTPLADLARAGIKARVETFWADIRAALDAGDEASASASTEITDMRVALRLITTNAKSKRYSWQASGSSWGTAETAPEGLAAALLAQLADSGRAATVTVRLAPGLPVPLPGDARAGILCQSVSVDLKGETAAAAFGSSAHLSVDDLSSFMQGFRNLRRSESSWSLRTEQDMESADEEAEAHVTVAPLSDETFSMGGFVAVGAANGGKTSSMDPKDIGQDGGEAKFRKIVYAGPDGETLHAWVIATEPAEGDGGDEPEAKDPCADHPGGGAGGAVGADGAGGGGGSLGGGGGGSGPVDDGKPVCVKGNP